MGHLLLVEDDHHLATEVFRGLREAGHTVELATTGEGVVQRVVEGRFDLLVLDLMLPEVDGHEVLEGLRDRSSVPVIVLSARTDLDARLESFGLGAVDYVSKPFFIKELLARIDLRLGRRVEARRVVTWGAVEVDLDGRVVTLRGEDIGLTPHEFNVVAYLVDRPGRAISRRQLAEHALTEGAVVSPRTVDAHMVRVRKKLGPDGQRLATVWGVGYRFDPT